MVEAGADRFDRTTLPRRALEDRIRRHDAGDAGGEGAKERTHVIREMALPVRRSAEGSKSSVVIVAVVALACRAVADPVLDHGCHGSAVDAAGAVLESLDVRAHHPLGERCIFPERTVDAAPARLGRDVGLRRERHLDAHGAVLAPRDVTEVPNERRVADRGETQRFGPLRELIGPDARPGDVLEVAPRVRADG